MLLAIDAGHSDAVFAPGDGRRIAVASVSSRASLRSSPNLVHADRQRRGGMIVFGIDPSPGALVGNMAKLPRIAIPPPKSTSAIGTDTQDRMPIDAPARVIPTGGPAGPFDDHPGIGAVDPDPTLDGSAILAERAQTQ